jgi:hypothetical protein
MRQIPFTLYLKVEPTRPEKRQEQLYQLSSLARIAYTALAASGSLNLAKPGGGGDSVFSGVGLSGYQHCMAAKPAFGDRPAQLVTAGFHLVAGDINPSPHAEMMVIAHNEVYTGYRAHGHDSLPTTDTDANVAALKTLVTSLLDAAMPDDAGYAVYRIDYNGVIYGDAGHHFPN